MANLASLLRSCELQAHGALVHALTSPPRPGYVCCAEPVALEVDATNCDSAAHPKLPVIATIAGQELESGANAGLAKEGWNFIAVMKRKNEVQLWIGNPGDSAPQKVYIVYWYLESGCSCEEASCSEEEGGGHHACFLIEDGGRGAECEYKMCMEMGAR